MGAQEFDFATGKVVNSGFRQIVVLSGCEPSCEFIEQYARGNRHKFLGKSADLRQALELVRKFKQGVFFLDADSDGVDVLPLVKVLAEKAPAFHVILMSQAPTKELLSQGKAARVAGFLVKPLSIDAIEKVMERIKTPT